MKTITIQYKGKPEIVEFDDDLKFGEVEDIQAKCVEISDALNNGVKLDIPLYKRLITLAAVKKAPWPVHDEMEYRGLSLKLGNQIAKEATSLYPLRNYLLELMTTVAGDLSEKQLKAVEALKDQ